jgi:hypothetical protein
MYSCRGRPRVKTTANNKRPINATFFNLNTSNPNFEHISESTNPKYTDAKAD